MILSTRQTTEIDGRYPGWTVGVTVRVTVRVTVHEARCDRSFLTRPAFRDRPLCVPGDSKTDQSSIPLDRP